MVTRVADPVLKTVVFLLGKGEMGILKQIKVSHILAFLALAVFLFTVGRAVLLDSGAKNLYAHQANAFLEGRLDIPDKLSDVSVFEGKYYVPFPPFPALLLTPLVALLGVERTNATLVAVVLTILSVYTLFRILKQIEIDNGTILWVGFGFFLGTGYWYTVRMSTLVWYFAHVVSVAFILLAVRETLGKGRGILAGLFLGAALLSRQLTVYTSVFLLIALWIHRKNISTRARLREAVGFSFSLGLCLAAYLFYNWARFGHFLDTGYAYLDLGEFLESRVSKYGLFHPAYFPFNFVYMFLQGPHLVFEDGLFPIGMDKLGTSLVYASPFVITAFFARWNGALLTGAWCSIGLTLFHMLLYYNNGWIQINSQRFSLDFLPLLILLVALSSRRVDNRILRAAIAYSVFLNILALFILPVLARLS